MLFTNTLSQAIAFSLTVSIATVNADLFWKPAESFGFRSHGHHHHFPTPTRKPHPLPTASPSTGEKLVFAHFMIGIVGDRTNVSDYDDDMLRAKDLGIDAFALNIGTDSYSDTQLDLAYRSAAKNGMKVFLSFDFNWWNAAQAEPVGQKIALYSNRTSQLMVDGKVFVSTFGGDALDVPSLRKAAKTPIFFAPNFHPSYGTNMSSVDGALNWAAWPSDGNNRAPSATSNISVADGDAEYISALGDKAYVAPVSPWFYTHYGPEVSYSKNWVFPSDLLWYERWNEILDLQPRFIEIITWNDYGESHYIGPLASEHYDDGASKWANDMPHGGWLDMAKPYIAAFKDGVKDPKGYITEDKLIYWYRPTMRGLNCDATDTTMVAANNASGNYYQGRPNGWQTMEDSVFVVSLLTVPGIVTIMSGNTTHQFKASAGVNTFKVPMQVGKQQFFLQRFGVVSIQAQSLKDIVDVCICGLYNFNAYVGVVPDAEYDRLGTDGLNSLRVGLHVKTCLPTPTLPYTTYQPTVTPPGAFVVIPAPTRVFSTSTPLPTACDAGTGTADQYDVLCEYTCQYGYCPSGPCQCTLFAQFSEQEPTWVGTEGYVKPGLGEEYTGLCSYACNHGFCPEDYCTTTPPVTSSSISSTAVRTVNSTQSSTQSSTRSSTASVQVTTITVVPVESSSTTLPPVSAPVFTT